MVIGDTLKWLIFFYHFQNLMCLGQEKESLGQEKKIILGPFSFSTHEIIWPVKFIVKINW